MSKQGAAFPFFIALLTALLFGAAAPISKPLLDHLSAFQLGGRLSLGAAAGVIVLLLREGKFLLPCQMDRKNVLRLAGAVLLSGLQLASAAPGSSTGVCTTLRSPRSMRSWPSGIPLSNKAAQKSYSTCRLAIPAFGRVRSTAPGCSSPQGGDNSEGIGQANRRFI